MRKLAAALSICVVALAMPARAEYQAMRPNPFANCSAAQLRHLVQHYGPDLRKAAAAKAQCITPGTPRAKSE